MKRLAVLFFFLLTVQAQAQPVTVHVQNDRGVPQLAEVYVGEGFEAQTNGYGDAFVDAEPGEMISATRDHYQTCSPSPSSPEGVMNPGYSVVYQGEATVTVTVPTITTTLVEPSVNANESWLVARINQDRARNGLAPLVIYDQLNQAADNFASYMNSTRNFSHCALYGIDARIVDTGWTTWEGGLETIVNATNPYDAYTKWANSPDHYRVLLNTSSTAVGVGSVGDVWVLDFTQVACPNGCPANQGTGNINAIPQAPIVQTPQNTYIPPVVIEPEPIEEPVAPEIYTRSQRLGDLKIKKGKTRFEVKFSKAKNPSQVEACFAKGKTKKCYSSFSKTGSSTVTYKKSFKNLKGKWKLTIEAKETLEGNTLWLGKKISKSVSF